MATRATFLDGDNRVYMTIEEEGFAEVGGFLLRNGWAAKRPVEKDFPLTVKDSAGNEFTVSLDEVTGTAVEETGEDEKRGAE